MFSPAAMGTRALILAVFVVSVSHVIAASESDRSSAEAVKEDVRVLQREVEELIGFKNYDKAIATLKEKGAQWQRQYGVKSWPMAEVSTSLADAFMACGSACDKESDAAELYEKAALVKREAYGEAHAQYAAAIEKAADAFVKVDEPRRALRHYKVLAKKVATGLGESHEAMKNIHTKLAKCAMKVKSYKTAAQSYTQLLESSLDSEAALHARLGLSVALAKSGRHKAAYQNAEIARDFAAESFGKTDMRYAKALNAIAGTLEGLNQDEEALRLMRDASEIVTKKFGAADPMARQAKKNLEGLRNHIRAKGKDLDLDLL